MIQFEVEGRPISLNQIYTNHWSKRGQDKQILWWKLKAVLLQNKISHEPLTTTVRINFKFHLKRGVDPDNCAGTVKLIIDYLREWGLLKNDSPEFVSQVCMSVMTGRAREFVQVTINE